MPIKKHAISSTTPKDVVFGAGIVVKGLKWESNDWNYDELGATTGGAKFSYTREFVDLELDGKQVKIEGMDLEVGSTGKITMNLAEYKKDTLVMALGLAQDTQDNTTGYACYKPAGAPTYIENLGFIGFTAEGKPVIAVFDKACCLGAYEVDFTKLPVRFYYPTATV